METLTIRRDALRSAITRAGSQSAFARLCEVSQPAVWKWLNVACQLPAEHVLTVEAATGVSRHELRPDIYPVERRSRRKTEAGRSIAA